MMYNYNGNYVSESKLDEAVKLVRAFEAGELEKVNERYILASKVMQGKQVEAVKLCMEAYGMSRNDARKYMVDNGKEMCKEYIAAEPSQEYLSMFD